MNLRTITLFLLLFIPLSIQARINIIDDSGQNISLKQPARRIISLSPGITELVFAAGGGNKLIGVVSYSDYPPQAKKIPQIGSYDSLDIERILALQPDLVIAWKSGNPEHQIQQLQQLGLTVYISEPRDFMQIPQTIRKLGLLSGTEPTAQQSATDFIKRFEQLKTRYKKDPHKKRLKTFIQIWNNPLMSVNGEHLISRVIEFCGGENIFAQAKGLTSTPSIEAILEEDPQVIIATGMAESSKQWLQRWLQWPFIRAVKNNRLYAVNPDHLVRHTPRILQGINEVCQKLNK